jgi:hypothetical protein
MSPYHTSTLKEAKALLRRYESRGDFNYTGIGKLFEIIERMTAEFWIKHSLPSVEYLIKASQLPEEQVVRYLKTLMTTLKPLIRKITIVEKDPAGFGGQVIPTLISYDVFCFPADMDKSSTKVYYKEYNRRTISVLSDYYTRDYVIKNETQIKESLLMQIRNQNFFASHPTVLIEKLFESEFDINPKLRNEQQETIINPVIQGLIDKRIFTQKKNSSKEKLAFDSVILINKNEELISRFNVLSAYFSESILSIMVDDKILDQSQIVEIQEDINLPLYTDKIHKLVELSLEEKKHLSEIHNQIISELFITTPSIASLIKNKEEEQRKQKIDEIIKIISKHNCLIDLNKHRFEGGMLNEDLRRGVLNNPEILSTTYAINKRVGTFAAHKDNLKQLLKTAKIENDIRNNPNELLILIQMGIFDFMSEEDQNFLIDIENSCYSRFLSILYRIFLFLFRRQPNPIKLHRVKIRLKETQERDLEIAQQLEAKEKMKRLEQEVDEKMKKDREGKENFEEDGDSEEMYKSPATPEEIEKKRLALDKMIQIIEKAWEKKELPNRITLQEHFAEFDEDELLRFLKKESKGLVKSFMVLHPDPKYKWPILITKNWIIRNGHSMLAKARKITDEQRNALYPDQERFELYYAMENFLTRQLTLHKR